MTNKFYVKNEARLQAMHDVEMRPHRHGTNFGYSHYCTDKALDRLSLVDLAEVWVNPVDGSDYMLEIRSSAMGPHFLKLTKDEVIWLVLEAEEKGWFEDV